MGVGALDSSAFRHFKNVTFYSTRIPLTIAANPIYIQEGKPFSFENSLEQKQTEKTNTINNNNDDSNNVNTHHITRDVNKIKPSITALRWVSVVGAITCTAFSLYYADRSRSNYSKYKGSTNDADAHEYRVISTNYQKRAIALGIGGGVSSALFGFSIAFGGAQTK